MSKKKVIRIDEDKCVGCGKCVNACHGGALELVDGKAKVTREDYCDGLGACIGECPFGAISFEEVERSAPAAAPAAPAPKKPEKKSGGCPGSMSMKFDRKPSAAATQGTAGGPSALNAWPIQLHLVSPTAEQFQGTDVLIAASCSAFSMGNFHPALLEGRGLVIACPKLDMQDGYLEKLTDMFALAKPRSVTVARMEVPCCGGLVRLVEAARTAAGSDLSVNEVIIGLNGELKGIRNL
ncbi:MAG: ATP-binding protein [Sedimentisphaeraceae bacterium JB056]